MASPGFAETKKAGTILRSITVTPPFLEAVSTLKYGPTRLDERVGHLPDPSVAELTCSCPDYKKVKPGRAPWCGHLAHAYVMGLDVPPDEELPGRLAVTLFQYPALVAWVELGPPSIPFSYRTVTPLSRRTGEAFGGVIGVMTPHCGRQVLRGYVMDFLVSTDWKSIRCESSWHTEGTLHWERENGFNQRDKTHLACLADLLWTGFCRSCNEDDGVPDV